MITITATDTASPLEDARRAALDLAEHLAASRDNGGTAVREYTIRYRVVKDIDGSGSICEHCQQRTVKANIYVRTMDGGEDYAQSCTGCVLPVIDGHLDTDPAYIVTVEQPQ